jgi:hypothetical protein
VCFEPPVAHGVLAGTGSRTRCRKLMVDTGGAPGVTTGCKSRSCRARRCSVIPLSPAGRFRNRTKGLRLRDLDLPFANHSLASHTSRRKLFSLFTPATLTTIHSRHLKWSDFGYSRFQERGDSARQELLHRGVPARTICRSREWPPKPPRATNVVANFVDPRACSPARGDRGQRAKSMRTPSCAGFRLRRARCRLPGLLRSPKR